MRSGDKARVWVGHVAPRDSDKALVLARGYQRNVLEVRRILVLHDGLHDARAAVFTAKVRIETKRQLWQPSEARTAYPRTPCARSQAIGQPRR